MKSYYITFTVAQLVVPMIRRLRTINSILVSSILLLLSSCNNERKPEKDPHSRLSVESKGYIAIPIDSISLNYSTYPYYFHNDTIDYYITGNEIINSIDFYDLKKKKLIRRNVYPKEGVNGILFTHDVYAKSLDSIYLYCFDDKKVLLTNFHGEVLRHYRLPDVKIMMSHLAAPFTVIGDNAFVGYMTIGDNRLQVGHKTMVKFNLSTGAFEEFGTLYPPVFSKFLYENFIPAYTFGPENNIVVRHGSLPDIYNYSINVDSTRAFPMRSKLQRMEIVPNKEVAEVIHMDDDFEELVQPSYGGVYYDKFKELYYSMYFDGIPIYDADSLRNQFDDKPMSIIVFNRKFQYLGEVQLDKNKYVGNFIPTSLGLLIPTSHRKNPDSKDDVLQFEIFDIHEKMGPL
jgi:hypothetical protein